MFGALKMNYEEVESKWQQEWEDASVFDADPDQRQSYMVSTAFPYVNGPPHMGHVRTYGTADVLARYKRMRGFNVLFPIGYHVTGTPIIAQCKRIKNKDPIIIKDLKKFGISDEDIDKMGDPMYLASYFINEFRNAFRTLGFGMDWRRQLVSIDPKFSKFVEWQFSILNENGLLTKGKHPVGWCPNENNAVGMHDTKSDTEPEIEEMLGIKFQVENEDYKIVCATYRPETLYGVTNIFIKDGVRYAICEVNGERLCLSSTAAERLAYQMDVKIISEIEAADLFEKKYINPKTGNSVPALSGFFVDEKFGTGMVMSVPAHAPFDYAALLDLKKKGSEAAAAITPIKVIELDSPAKGQEIPSVAYIDVENREGDPDSAAIESATKNQYKEELRSGVMIIGDYKGQKVKIARDSMWKDLMASNDAFVVRVIANNAVCRCGFSVVVKIVDDQWFLNYGDEGWKVKAREALKNTKILPEKLRPTFEGALEWINLRAVARAQGLGTKFPLDNTKIIESLSDSTIYMSLYTIWNIIENVESEKLTKEFFDYVYRGKGSAEEVSKTTGISYEIVKRSRESFEYWYTFTSRHSGSDLIFNHLTMYLFNHSVIFNSKYWPKQIAINGTILCEGEKMSKSLGNTIDVKEALGAHGADVTRFMVICSADLFGDSEYSNEAARGIKERLDYIDSVAGNLSLYSPSELKHIDYWLYSRLNKKIITATNAMDKLELRTASTAALYEAVIELKRYFLRGGNNQIVITEYLSNLALLLGPLTPHFSEELWHKIGNESFVAKEKWPTANESMLNSKMDMEEELLDKMIEDSKHVLDLVKRKGKEPSEIKYIVASEYKYILNNELAKDKNVKRVMEMIKSGELENSYSLKFDLQKCMDFVSSMAKHINAVNTVETNPADQYDIINDAKEYIGSGTGCRITVEREDESKSSKAAASTPMKPGIEVL